MRKLTILFLICAAALPAADELANRRAPGFSLPDALLAQHDLQEYRGKVVLVEFMATGCPHCRNFVKVLQEAERRYGDKLAIVNIVNPPDTQSSVGSFLREFKVKWPMVFDCGQVAASYLKITPDRPTIVFPHLFVIDQQGMIRHDYGYDAQTTAIFEGPGLYKVLDEMLSRGRTIADAGKR